MTLICVLIFYFPKADTDADMDTAADVWLNYIELECSHGQGKPENIAHLHWRAVKDLSPQLVDEFRCRVSTVHSAVNTTLP